MKILGIIPARYASTRFPGKPLAMLEGKTIIQRVFEQASKAKNLDLVVVATDDQTIYNHVIDFGGNAIMTKTEHKSGTDRVFEAASNLGQYFDVVVNIQGDEPFIDPRQIDLLCQLFENKEIKIATQAVVIADSELLFNPNSVKVVFSNIGNALYFSRNPIPYVRDAEKSEWLSKATFHKHLGIYAFRFDILSEIVKLPQSNLEKLESLEQLRWLENGFQITVQVTDKENIGIDTYDDLLRAIKILKLEKP